MRTETHKSEQATVQAKYEEKETPKAAATEKKHTHGMIWNKPENLFVQCEVELSHSSL